mmetsp:Transcript_24598/g.46442  ORF Transcript_24598/g.46442 Transcript_24598/m.46442 type:complete len:179 (+) Transcript_24598:40-576(+)
MGRDKEEVRRLGKELRELKELVVRQAETQTKLLAQLCPTQEKVLEHPDKDPLGQRETTETSAANSRESSEPVSPPVPAGSAAARLLGRWHGFDHNLKRRQWHEVYWCTTSRRVKCTTWTEGVPPRSGRVSSITMRDGGNQVMWGKGDIALDERHIQYGRAVWSNPDPKKSDWIWEPGW